MMKHTYRIIGVVLVATLITSMFAGNVAHAEEEKSEKATLDKLAEDVKKLHDILSNKINDLYVKSELGGTPGTLSTEVIYLSNTDWETVREALPEGFRASLSGSTKNNTIVITASQEIIHLLSETIPQLDVPEPTPPSIEIRTYVLFASNYPIAIENDVGKDAPVPEELQEALTELRAAFPFKNYRLIDSSIIRCQDGNDIGFISNPAIGDINFSARVSVSPDMSSVNIGNMYMRIISMNQSYPEFRTDVNIKSGQTVLVGKGSVTNNEMTMFLALTAKVVE